MFIPDNYKLIYNLEIVKKTYTQFKLHSAEKHLLPELIRLEKNNGYNSITGADNLIRIRNAPNWTKCSLTGLRPTETPEYYYADIPTKPNKSLLVVYLPKDKSKIEIRVARQFYPAIKPELYRIVNEIIQKF